jgi:hypothetical protein
VAWVNLAGWDSAGRPDMEEKEAVLKRVRGKAQRVPGLFLLLAPAPLPALLVMPELEPLVMLELELELLVMPELEPLEPLVMLELEPLVMLELEPLVMLELEPQALQHPWPFFLLQQHQCLPL